MASAPTEPPSALDAENGPATRSGSAESWRAWFWKDVLAPFVGTRALLFLAAWFAGVFAANPGYPAAYAARQGWQFTPLKLLDMWGRWDSGWYMDIALSGYTRELSFATVQSKIAFFPLFPLSVRGILWLLGLTGNRTAAMWVGVLLANAALLVALVAIRQLVAPSGAPAARRAVLYVLTFPTGLFLSCFYPESLFLATTALACLLATRGRWLMASIVGAIATLSRPYGVMIALPLLWLYLSSRDFRLSRVRLDGLGLLLVPATLLGLLLVMRPLTGHLLAPFGAQAAWHRHLSWPWDTLFRGFYFEGSITRIQQCLALAVVALSIWALLRLPSRAYGLYALVITVPSLLSGTLMGIGRHAVVVFPVYMVLAVMTRRERVHAWLQAVNLTVQVLFMAAWVRFYPVV